MRLVRSVVSAICFLAVGIVGSPSRAGSYFDPFRTEGALRRDADGMNDPYGRECATPSGPLTFPAAVDFALCRNPQTRSAWAIAHEQAAALGEAESAWLPSITATGQDSEFTGQHADILGNLVTSSQNQRDAAAMLSWTLYDFGGRTAKIQSARGLLDAAAATANSVSQQTIRLVVQSYYGVVSGDAALAAARTTEEVTAHSLDIARSLQSGGVGTQADVLQAETAHSQAVLSRLQAEAAAQTARGALDVTLGLNADYPLKLDPEPVPTEVPALSARVTDLMAEATRQRPDLKAARAQRDAAEANVTVARAVGRPSIIVGATHNFVSTSGIPNENYNEIGVTLNVPIFSGFNVSYNVRQAQATVQQQEENLEQVSLTVTQDVWSSYYTLDSANQQLSETAQLIRTADENLRVALGRYQAGVGSIVDVLTAQTAAASSRTLRINAELGWKVARAQLALALGRLTNAEPINSSSLP